MSRSLVFFSCLACACRGKRVSTPRKASPEIDPLTPLATLLVLSDLDSAFQSFSAAGTLARHSRIDATKMALSRREAILGGGLAVASALALPAQADFVDPISTANRVAASKEKRGPIKRKDGKPNTGAELLRDCFDGVPPPDGILKWYEEHLSEDFVAEFVGGPTLDRKTYLDVTADVLKSFPNLRYVSIGAFKFAESPFKVQWTGYYEGTHSGAPFSPASGAPAIAAKSPAAAYETPAALSTAVFERGTEPKLNKIKQLTIKAPEGQLAGPFSLYVQAGGDASKLPKAAAPAKA